MSAQKVTIVTHLADNDFSVTRKGNKSDLNDWMAALYKLESTNKTLINLQ